MADFKYPEGSLITLIDADSFGEFIKAYDYVLVHFGATWNGYDKMIIPLVIETANRLRNKVHFAVLDVDLEKNFELCRGHCVLNVPFIEYYIKGGLQESFIGYDATTKKSNEKSHPTTTFLNRLLDKLGVDT